MDDPCTAGSNGLPGELEDLLEEFTGYLPELLTLARTVDRWRDPLITAIQTGVSNARTEGLNRVIKLEGRKAYGFRNPTNQRRRLRYATTRTPRRPPTATGRPRPVTSPPPRPG